MAKKAKGGFRRPAKKRKMRGHAALPIIPTIVMLAPEATVGIHALADLDGGAPPAKAAADAWTRFQALYGGPKKDAELLYGVPVKYDLTTNAKAKAAGVLLHAVARAFGVRVRISKRFTLF